ncbi:phosphoenolpyruvate phosphomutase-domain-containing protein [Mycena floridula]|nr:phosphoenolpyruvate phosphomutase-domain-containing protein [Mycena floridula]
MLPALQNDFAIKLAALHSPGNPLILANVHDCVSAEIVASLTPQVKALATGSYAIAAVNGFRDDEMSLEDNIEGCRKISKVAESKALPLTVDLRDGYGTRLVEAITMAISIGATGANIEDSFVDPGTQKSVLYPIDEMVLRLEQVRAVATAHGIPDFVVNARTDAIYIHGLEDGVQEALKRGQAYLATGVPSTIFIFDGPVFHLTKSHILDFVGAFDGRVALLAKPGLFPVKELTEMGVARISVGPFPLKLASEVIRETAQRLFNGGVL